MKRNGLLLGLLFSVFCLILSESCRSDNSVIVEKEVTVVDSSAFDEAKDVVYTLGDEFTIDLWAPGPLLRNAVALTFDHQGNAYVGETHRRKSSDIDIREHWDWTIEELALQSLDQTRDLHMRKLATELSDQNTWMTDFNEDGVRDYRDLAVQSEIIRKIYDSDGDGRADASYVFADGFNSMLTGVGAGLLHHNKTLFYTAAPKLYSMEDEDDGDVGKRKVLSEGYGIHIAYAGHDMSGLVMGHDGKIYWSIGDMGLNVTDATGKEWKYPNQGAVMRCNPDGSDFEVFAHGLRNPQELAFDAYGNLFSVDNDGDHAGEKERYVHILEGSDTGWRINWQYGKYDQPYESYKVWMDERLSEPHFEGQAAYVTPALALAPNGPAGLAYNPGTALGTEWNDYFFSSYFTGSAKSSQIQAFKLKPEGASFAIDEVKDVQVGINSTGISFGPDGALYVNDWKDSYDKKEQGRIWKLDVKEKNKDRANTQQLLREQSVLLEPDRLAELLDHPDMRVRQMSQFELVKRGLSEVLLDKAQGSNTLFGRLHAIWGYGQLMRKDSKLGAEVFELLNDENDEVRAQAAKVIGDARYTAATSILTSLLEDPSERVQMCAAEALGKMRDAAAFESLVKQLEKIKDAPHHRHVVSYALSRLGEAQRLEQLKSHASSDVRMGAVLALRHLSSPLVSSYLMDRNPLVVTEAARAIHDDFSIEGAMQDLARSLAFINNRDEAYLRRAINANLRIGDKDSAGRLAEYYFNNANDRALRLDALWALGYWKNPPLLDRVDNRYRELDGGDMDAALLAFADIFKSLIVQKDPEFVSMILQVAGKLDYKDSESTLVEYLKDPSQNVDVRKAGLHSLQALNSGLFVDAMKYSISEGPPELRTEAQKLIGLSDLAPSDKLNLIKTILQDGSVKEKQSVLSSLKDIQTEETVGLLTSMMDNIKDHEKEIELDILEAARAQESESLDAILESYKSGKDEDKLSQYRALLYGGDAQKGRDVLAFNQSAQCLRCHALGGYGTSIGPPLDGVGGQLSREDLLLSLIDPSAEIAAGYGQILWTLADGSEVSGVVASETTDSIIINNAAGVQLAIWKKEITTQESLGSGMLSVEKTMEPRDIRDLVEFLANLK